MLHSFALNRREAAELERASASARASRLGCSAQLTLKADVPCPQPRTTHDAQVE